MNNNAKVYLPPIQDLLYRKPLNSFWSNENTDIFYKKSFSNSSCFASYPRAPDPGTYYDQNKKGALHYRDHSAQAQYSSNPFSNRYYYPSLCHQKGGTVYNGWNERSADGYRKKNEYTDDSQANKATNGTTNVPRNYGVAEPLQQEQNVHSRSFSDQFLPRSAAFEYVANNKSLICPMSAVDPPRSFHRRTASDMLSFFDIKKKKYTCSTSSDQAKDNNTFTNKDGRSLLSKKAISINAYRYKCKKCFKDFSRPSSLRIHVLSHTGEKPHVCPRPDCGRRFSVQSNMRRHLKVHSCNISFQQQ